MAEDKTIIEWAPILHLPPVNTEQMESYALQRYLEFFLDVHKAVPTLYLLNDEDLGLFLSDTEYARLKASEDEIKGWLEKCDKNNDEATLKVYPYHSPFNAMWDLRKLLKKVAEGKAKRERRVAALVEIDPPFDDAKKYLTKKEEYQEFLDSLPGAADAYLGRDENAERYYPNIWLLNSKASDYSYWTLVIRGSKEKEARKKRAELEHSQFLKDIKDAIKTCKQELAKEKKPKFAYPAWLRDYHPNLWCELELPTKQRIEDWARPQIQERVPLALRDFVSWELSWEMQTSPDAKYEVLGVLPCLTWWFTVLVLVKVHLRVVEKTFTREFHGHRYAMKVDAEELGCIYLGPVLGGHQEGFTTPIALLLLLAKGELETPCIAVTNRGSPFTTFTIEGFEEETLEVHDVFRRFIKDIAKEQPLAQALLAKGLVDQDTAKLIEAKWDEPLPVSGKVSDTGGADLESVAAKLVELGKTEAEAKKAVESITLPKNATTEEVVSIILGKSYSDS